MRKERWTVLRVLEWTQEYLRKKEIPSPRLEGELLLSHLLGCDRVGLYLNYDMALLSEELSRFRGFIERRVRGEPLQYITGYQEFWSIRFMVDPHVLIPRPETEVLVEKALSVIEQEGWQEARILEVGTGCGAIAVSIAKSVASTWITATEISWEALVLARGNARAQSVASRIDFVQADLLSFMRHPRDGIFNLIISNPPYVREDDIKDLQPEIRDFEPKEALNGGVDGLDFCRRLLAQAPPCLKERGWLILEIGADQGVDVFQLFEEAGNFGDLEIIPDYAGRNRVMIARKGRY